MKLIASDMDGTLLNKYWRISDENRAAVLEAQAAGIHFVIATGRPYTNVNVIIEEAGISCPVISLNGAQTHDASGKLIASQPLSKQQVRAVHDILLEEGMYFELMTEQGAISLSHDRYVEIAQYYGAMELSHLPEVERHETVLRMCEERIRNERCQFVDSFERYLNDDQLDILKIFALTTDEECFNRCEERVRQLTGLAVSSSAHGNLEVNAQNGNKGYAVQQYAASLGLEPSDIMAMGDGFNDLSMLKMAGRGIVMDNAPDSLKALIANRTKRNTEHGVAYAIRQLLEEKGLSAASEIASSVER